VQGLNDACVPVAFTESYKGWPEIELKDGDRAVRRFKDFPRVTVEQMKAMFASRLAPRRIDELKDWGTPAYLIVDWNGKVLIENLKKGAVTAEAMLRDVREAAKKLGDGAGCADYRAYETGRREVEAAVDAGELGRAVKAWLGLARLKSVSKRIKGEIDLLNERIVSEGEHRLEEAKGGDELRKLAEAFAGHSFEKEIRARMK